MNIRTVFCGLMLGLCFQASAMDQEQFMQLTPSEIREAVQKQLPADASFVLDTLEKMTFSAVAALLIQDKLTTIPGKVVAGALGFFVAVKGIAFVANLLDFSSQKAQQEKMFRALMFQQQMMRKQILELDDSEKTGEVEE